MVTNPPAVWKTLVQSLGWEDPLQEEMATHTGILAWEIPQIGEPGRLQSTGLKIVGHRTEQLRTHSNVSAVLSPPGLHLSLGVLRRRVNILHDPQ